MITSFPLTLDWIVLSHLRWDFVFQRPQHLMSRAASEQRVFFFEEPVFDTDQSQLVVEQRGENIWVARPHLHSQLQDANEATLQKLLDELIAQYNIRDYACWYYTPMALGWSHHLKPRLTVYDCMDELSLFRGAPRELLTREAELFRRADLVFTGGQSLYEAKRNKHPRVYAFPSSVDKQHFAQARQALVEPYDQRWIPSPRLGFFGVIDERMDLELLTQIADARPDWQLVLIGPVVKIEPETLPQRTNIHYLGSKSYQDLPKYLTGWNVALLPFARNESTRFISPTKTPEYLAGGKPVVSTRITDVVNPYGDLGLVQIADTAPEFVNAIEFALTQQANDPAWLARVDEFLAEMSWDMTWRKMSELISDTLELKNSTYKSSPALARPLTSLQVVTAVD